MMLMMMMIVTLYVIIIIIIAGIVKCEYLMFQLSLSCQRSVLHCIYPQPQTFRVGSEGSVLFPAKEIISEESIKWDGTRYKNSFRFNVLIIEPFTLEFLSIIIDIFLLLVFISNGRCLLSDPQVDPVAANQVPSRTDG